MNKERFTIYKQVGFYFNPFIKSLFYNAVCGQNMLLIDKCMHLVAQSGMLCAQIMSQRRLLIQAFIRAWFVVLEKHERLWKAITLLIQLQKGF